MSSSAMGAVTIYSLNGVDYAYFAFMALSMIWGAVRGLTRSLLSMIVWLLAFILPGILGDVLAPHMAFITVIPKAQIWLSFIAIFLLVLIFGFLLSFIVKKGVDVSELNGSDRFLGLIFGFLRSIAVLAVLTVLISLTTLSEADSWRNSVLVPRFDIAIENILGVFPGDLTQKLIRDIRDYQGYAE